MKAWAQHTREKYLIWYGQCYSFGHVFAELFRISQMFGSTSEYHNISKNHCSLSSSYQFDDVSQWGRLLPTWQCTMLILFRRCWFQEYEEDVVGWPTQSPIYKVEKANLLLDPLPSNLTELFISHSVEFLVSPFNI